MGFKLLDVEKFIKEKQAKPVFSEKTFDIVKGEFIPNPNGLYSKDIFEGHGIKDAREKYGYIDLKTVILHPLIFKNLKKISGLMYKIATSKATAVLVDGVFEEAPASAGGKTGLTYLINNWDKIDFDKYKKDTNAFFIEFIKNSQKKLIFVKKIPVIPIIYRPSSIENGRVIEDELTELYKKILLDQKKNGMLNIKGPDLAKGSSLEGILKTNSDKSSAASEIDKLLNEAADLTSKRKASMVVNGEEIDYGVNGDEESLEVLDNLISSNVNITEKIQSEVVALFDYFITKLEKKEGFFRGSYVAKRVDNVSRLVANARPDVPVDCVALPWQVLINIFDYYVLAELENNPDIKEKLGLTEISVTDFGKHIYYIYKNCEIYCKSNPENEKIWIDLLTRIFNKHDYLRVIIKRDPGWSANSFWSLKPIIIKGCSYHIVLNSLYYSPLGGDSFTSRVIFYGEDKNDKDDKDEDKIIFNQNSEEIFEVILPKKRMKITSVESLFEKKN